MFKLLCFDKHQACFILPLLMVLLGCDRPHTDIYPEDPSLRTVPVFIVSHGWHTGIAIEGDALPGRLARLRQMPAGSYLMFEWGDAGYFPNEDPGFGLLLKAALLPTRSVIQITGMNVKPNLYFQNSTVVQVNITPEGMSALMEFLQEQFRIDSDGEPSFVQAGLYPNSAFFKANQIYMLPRTSNSWTANALRHTGYPVNPYITFTSESLIRQVKKDGVVLKNHQTRDL